MKYRVCEVKQIRKISDISSISSIVTGDVYVDGDRVAENVEMVTTTYREYGRPPFVEVQICEWEESGVRIKEKA